uniref:ATP synthase F(0) complex subunit e, mitochondrial n=1 Tax=Prolemur simus TaxID=1328070 RepID=A0A8C9DGJ2_PROSS
MYPPIQNNQVSLLIKLGHYSALFLGMADRATCYSYLISQAEEEKRIAVEEKKEEDELKRIVREVAEAQDDSIFVCLFFSFPYDKS